MDLQKAMFVIKLMVNANVIDLDGKETIVKLKYLVSISVYSTNQKVLSLLHFESLTYINTSFSALGDTNKQF